MNNVETLSQEEESPYISVVLQAYNEADRILKTLEAVKKYFSKKPHTFEVIVVSDGSKDSTEEVVRKAIEKCNNLRLVMYTPNRGKGYAVKCGMLSAKGKVRLYMDADNAIDINHLDNFLKELENGYDIVVGSVHLPGAEININYEWYRRILSFIGGLIMQYTAGAGLSDVLRAFKLFTASAAETLFLRQTIERFGFDMELMMIARHLNFRIKELPVRWLNPYGDRVTLKAYFFTLWELILVLINLFLKD